jgi:hypothetical protein
VLGENRLVPFIQLDDLGVLGRYDLNKVPDLLVNGGIVDKNFGDVRVEVVPNGSQGKISLFVKKRRRFFV